MKPWVKLSLVSLAAVVIATGCGSTDQGKEPAPTNPPGQQQPGDNSQQPGGNTQQPGKDADNAKVKKTVSLYFSDKDLMEMFRENHEIEADKEEDLAKAALEAWVKGPKSDKLTNLVPQGVVVRSVKGENGVAQVDLSKEIKGANLGSSGEIFLMDSIALIMKQFGYDSTQVLIEGKKEETLLGHVTANIPHKAPNPDNYKEMK